MGAYWLLDLPEACRSGGLDVSTFDGWETRSRSSGGYDDVLAVGYHHDASNVNSDDGSSDAYGWLYADDRPIGAMRLHRDGRLVVGAAGATNTMGRGGPLTVSGGVIPLDRGNQTMIAIEAANNGVGETWPRVQVDAYVALVAALCDWYGLDPTHDVFGHFDYCTPSCPGRKIDPAGPAASPYTDLEGPNSSGTWSLSAFRGHVVAWSGGGGTPPPNPEPEPEPEPPPNQGGADMAAIMPTIRKGDRGDYVERMQHLLAAAGYMNPTNAANYDGVWGNGTDDAKARFDNDHGLTPSPPTDCGAKSWESLLTGKKW